LAVGGTITFTVVANIDPSATGSITNTATVTPPPGVTDPNPNNNTGTDTDTVTGQADLQVTKTDGATSIIAGTTTTYTVVVSNNGPSTVTGATITDPIPAGLTNYTWSAVASSGSSVSATNGTGAINVTGDLTVGGTITFTVVATIDPAAAGSITNTATVTPPPGVTDPNPNNNTGTDTDTVTPQADLQITKTDGVTNVLAGTNTTYTIVVSNTGPSTATGATISDPMPAGVTTYTWTAVSSAGSSVSSSSGSGGINVTANIAPGGTITFTVIASIDPSDKANIVNTATVAPPPGTTDPNPGNNTAIDTDTVTPLGSIAGSVYKDSNNNGVQDPGEPNLAGVTVTLSGTSNGQPITRSMVTDATGAFSFNFLPPGTYSLTESQPAGLFPGVNVVGTGGGVLGQRSISNIGVGVSDQFVNYIFAQTPVDPNLITKRNFLASNSQNQGVSAAVVFAPTLSGVGSPNNSTPTPVVNNSAPNNTGISATQVFRPVLAATSGSAIPVNAPVVPDNSVPSTPDVTPTANPVTVAPVQTLVSPPSPIVLHFLAFDPYFGAVLLTGANGSKNGSDTFGQ
jgi:uncharacterized repeat protein (TIGR01451 family)